MYLYFQRLAIISVFLVSAFVVHKIVLAQESTPSTENKVVPLAKDTPAPFTGLLVPEARFTELLEKEIQADGLAGKLKIQEKLTVDLENIYTKRMGEMAKPLAWYETPEFNRWLGFFIGVGVTAGVVYGGVKMMEAMK